MTVLVAWSTNTAKPSVSLAIAPTSVSAGRSGSAGEGAGGAGAAAGAAATPGAGARRDGRNSGRSRVAVSRESGIAQSGLALGADGLATGWLGRPAGVSTGSGSPARGAAGIMSTGAG